MSKPTIFYWDIRGRAEVMRLILSHKGVDFDIVAPADMKTDKAGYPFGQAPRYKDDTVDMCQSNSILRYLGRKYDMEGRTEPEKVLVDQAMEAVESLRTKYVHLIYQDQLSDDAKAAFVTTHIAKDNEHGRNGGAHMAYLDWFLSKGKDGYITSAGLTVGDLAIWEVVDLLLRVFPDEVATNYPSLKEFHSRVAALPNIAAYLSSEKRPVRPNGNTLG